MAIREYIYKGQYTTATIINKKRYWELKIEHNKSNPLFLFGRNGLRITNTKRRAIEIFKSVEAGQFRMMSQFKK